MKIQRTLNLLSPKTMSGRFLSNSKKLWQSLQNNFLERINGQKIKGENLDIISLFELIYHPLEVKILRRSYFLDCKNNEQTIPESLQNNIEKSPENNFFIPELVHTRLLTLTKNYIFRPLFDQRALEMLFWNSPGYKLTVSAFWTNLKIKMCQMSTKHDVEIDQNYAPTTAPPPHYSPHCILNYWHGS